MRFTATGIDTFSAESGKINNSSQSAQRHAFSYSVIDLSSSPIPLHVIDLFNESARDSIFRDSEGDDDPSLRCCTYVCIYLYTSTVLERRR